MDQHVVPAEIAGVTQYEFVDWRTAEASQRAILEIRRSVAAARLLFGQMAGKRLEISRSMGDLSGGIAYAAREFAAVAEGLEKIAKG